MNISQGLLQFVLSRQQLLEKLYTSPTTCFAICRELPEVAQQYIMRLLFVEAPVSQTTIASWLHNDFEKSHSEAIEVLTKLQILRSVTQSGGMSAWQINTAFTRSLKTALFGEGKAESDLVEVDCGKHAKDVAFLEKYANDRWESILNYMVTGTKETEAACGKDATQVLVDAELLKAEHEGSPTITRAGFQFLLLSTGEQIWWFLVRYLDSLKARNLDLGDAVNFIVRLAHATLGTYFSTDNLSETQAQVLQNLREFGIAYQRSRKDGNFCVTPLALTFLNASSDSATNGNLRTDLATNSVTKPSGNSSANGARGYIIVETNFRLYAYTDSPLQIALIALFSEMLFRFPSFVVGNITRDNVRQALAMGISADQIINFLRAHSHPLCDSRSGWSIPPTVIDQIRLWELERERVRARESVLYKEIETDADFSVIRDYAQSISALIWQNAPKRMLIVTPDGHDAVRHFWKRYKRQHSADNG